tara:strand:+ start:353 stop:604 length:252 start_codon:yes stop_codon:yes gene_type:complete
MKLGIEKEITQTDKETFPLSNFKDQVFSKDYVDFLSDAGWKLEKKLPSNTNHYSDLLEDTDWKYNYSDRNSSKHYRRDLDALS